MVGSCLLRAWANCGPKELREEFYHIQRNLATIIFKDVFLAEGEFHANIPTKVEADKRNVLQGDPRPFKKLGDIFYDMPTASKT